MASEKVVRSLMEQVSASIRAQRKEAATTLEASRAHLRSLGEALGIPEPASRNLAGKTRP